MPKSGCLGMCCVVISNNQYKNHLKHYWGLVKLLWHACVYVCVFILYWRTEIIAPLCLKPTSHCEMTLSLVWSVVPGVPFTRVFALDQDDPETPNSHLSYSLVSQIPNRIGILFQINPNTGEISTTEEGSAHTTTRTNMNPDIDAQDRVQRPWESL